MFMHDMMGVVCPGLEMDIVKRGHLTLKARMVVFGQHGKCYLILTLWSQETADILMRVSHITAYLFDHVGQLREAGETSHQIAMQPCYLSFYVFEAIDILFYYSLNCFFVFRQKNNGPILYDHEIRTHQSGKEIEVDVCL